MGQNMSVTKKNMKSEKKISKWIFGEISFLDPYFHFKMHFGALFGLFGFFGFFGFFWFFHMNVFDMGDGWSWVVI